MTGELQLGPSTVTARLLTRADRPVALERLSASVRKNLLLIDAVARIGAPGRFPESPSQVLGTWCDGELSGVASLRPLLALDSAMSHAALDAIAPSLAGIETGLLKSAECVVTPLWQRLVQRDRRALLDRVETAYALDRGNETSANPATRFDCRAAAPRDLSALVEAARASLREEDRPDPFAGDPAGFRRWVRGRMARARVIELDRAVAFVAYADVRRPEGWLVQGVYTFPAARRRGLAAAGISALTQEAFAAGADHVQLAVVADNRPAIRLYEGLGFRPFDTLRTVLFV